MKPMLEWLAKTLNRDMDPEEQDAAEWMRDTLVDIGAITVVQVDRDGEPFTVVMERNET